MASAGSALASLGLVVVAGVAASWLAWRLDLPSILFLLLGGILVGPVTGMLDPDTLLGDLLFPVVSFSVGIILFEGGLSLRSVEMEETGGIVRNLVSVGVLVTWVLTAAGAHVIVGLDLGLSLLLGAIFTVTGPTVILPLLQHLRPQKRVANILKWEGIIIDPIGAVLAVLVFEALVTTGLDETALTVVGTVGRAALAGGVLGAAGAGFLYVVLRRHWAPDILRNPVTLASVVGVFALTETVQPESGLVATTVMGAILANRGDIAKRHIIEFKENLRVLLISFLFIILGARLKPSDLEVVSLESMGFLVFLILVVRPLAVWLSTLGSSLDLRERAFLAGVAPRGVVAAAISSVFALQLSEAGYAGADQLVPLSFLLIIGTVGFYGLAAGPLGRILDVVPESHDGVLMVGAHSWARDIGALLQEVGVPVLVMDTDDYNLEKAEERGLSTIHGNPIQEAVLEELDIAGIGHLVAITRHDELNTLSVLHFLEEFDRANAYQIPPAPGADEDDPSERPLPHDFHGRLLFDGEVTWRNLDHLLDEGWEFRVIPIEVETRLPEGVYPFARVGSDGELAFATADQPIEPVDGDRVIVLTPPDEPPENPG